jgi:uncharacterized protein (DUF58 family)
MKPSLSGLRRRRFRLPRRLRVTFEGKGFILLTLGVGVAAVNTGNNLLYITLSINLSLIVLSGILSEWCIRGVTVLVRHASEAFVSRESLLAITCFAGGKRFPPTALSVSMVLDGVTLTARFPEIPAGGESTRILSVRPARRGTLSPGSCSISTLFPFALFEKSMDVSPRASLVVYPEPADAGSSPRGEDPPEPAGDVRIPGREGTEIRGAREHAPADPVRDIHWKASARMGRWMVKERERESAPVADLRLPVPCPPPIEFERLVSRACAFVLRCDREGRPYRLRLGDRVCVDASRGGRRAHALAFLAFVGADGTLPGGGTAS